MKAKTGAGCASKVKVVGNLFAIRSVCVCVWRRAPSFFRSLQPTDKELNRTCLRATKFVFSRMRLRAHFLFFLLPSVLLSAEQVPSNFFSHRHSYMYVYLLSLALALSIHIKQKISSKKVQEDALDDHLCTCTTHSGVKKQQVVRNRGHHCGDVELDGYLVNTSDPVSLVLDLLIGHERCGSNSDPTLNGNLYYPNDIDRSLNETAADKIRKYGMGML